MCSEKKMPVSRNTVDFGTMHRGYLSHVNHIDASEFAVQIQISPLVAKLRNKSNSMFLPCKKVNINNSNVCTETQ